MQTLCFMKQKKQPADSRRACVVMTKEKRHTYTRTTSQGVRMMRITPVNASLSTYTLPVQTCFSLNGLVGGAVMTKCGGVGLHVIRGSIDCS